MMRGAAGARGAVLMRKRRRPVWLLGLAAVGSIRAAHQRAGFVPMSIYYNDIYRVDLPDGHRFPMPKYELVRKEAQRRLDGSGLATFHQSPLASVDDLSTTHCPQYIERFLQGRMTEKESRVVGFPWSIQSVHRTLSSVAGTVAATHSVCQHLKQEGGGPFFAGHVAGGTHHAFYDRGEGFCYFSDIAVAANVALRDYPEVVRRVLIIDLDVHQGNGNAALFHGDDRVFTFSMHCSGNYFSKKEASDVDVEVAPGTGDEAYLHMLREWVPRLYRQVDPDLVFFQAGIDPIESDRLGQLKLTRAGLRDRNAVVYDAALRHGRAPLVVTMGGGYPKDLDPTSRPFQAIVDAHADVYVQAALARAQK